MTDLELADWEARHESIIKWGRMWMTLVLIFAVIVLYLVFATDDPVLTFGFLVAEFVFWGFHGICEKRHMDLHDTWEEMLDE